ncbi:MAG: XdhC/CoxI family protein [Chloroflexota bacterium]|nr:XdhC/CoxI family protein [Chloroflexota bacterium]
MTDLARWLAAGEQIALATVVWAGGPSPRPLGSRLAVTGSGQMAGSVSGGCVEGAVFQEAQTVLSGGPPKRLRYGVVDETGWQVGLACGGTIEVYVEPLVNIHRRLLDALEVEETVALATRLCDSDGGHLLAWPDGRLEGDPSLASELTTLFPGPAADLRHLPAGDVFFEVFAPPLTLTIVGAVHVAVPLVTLAQALGFHVRVVDARRVFATRTRFPTADELITSWPQDALQAEELGPQHHIVILTHDPKFDLPALQIALRSQAAYIGLIGSHTTQAKRKAALREKGFSEEELARIHGPVGLDLGGREPAEIALAILAEIVAARHGRDGGRLSGAVHLIHQTNSE